jgi:hypothetical protein
MATLANPRPVVCASQRANASGSSSLLAHHIIQKGAFAPRRSNTSSRHPASLRTRPSAKKEGAQKKAVKPTVPDAPPSKGPSEQAHAVEESYERADTVASTTAAEGEQTATTEPLSVDEIAQQMAELRAERQQRPSKEGLVEVRRWWNQLASLSQSMNLFPGCVWCWWLSEYPFDSSR